MKALVLTFIMIFWSVCIALGAQFDGGYWHSVAVNDDGMVWAWGWGHYGLLGNGTTNNSLVPVEVSGLSDVIAVDVGSGHSLALKHDGTVWAWGANNYGSLGDGTTVDRWTPVQVVGLTDVVEISVGSHSLALKRDGTVWAWGWNNDGQLGDGTTVDRWTPVQVVGLTDVVAISAGSLRHSMALKHDGTPWAWGWGHYGQLGHGSGGLEATRLMPIPFGELSDVISINAGSRRSQALKRDGTVWLSGIYAGTRLEELVEYDAPIQVLGLPPAVDIGNGGGDFSLILAIDGTVWFWGGINYDRTWISISRYSSENLPVSLMPGNSSSAVGSRYWSASNPVPINGISQVVEVAGGEDHALFLKSDGKMWAWGDNYRGELGDGTTTSQLSPVQVRDFSSGSSGSVPSTVLAADFDADGKADPTAISSSGELFYWNSSQSFSREGPISLGVGDLSPIALATGDVNGDGRPDLAVVQGSDWHFFLSGSNGYSLHTETFGQTGTPLLADFDGDGKADPAIVNSSGTWYFWLSADGYSPVSAPFAVSGATPVAGDFDADGRADPVMVTSAGGWYLWPSSQMYTQHGPYNFGVSGKPVAGDFDGDGKADPGIVDSSGNWYLMLSSSFYLPNGPWYLVLP